MDLTSLEGLQAAVDTTPLHRFLEFKVTELDVSAGHLVIESPTTSGGERSDGAGQAHGGAIATLIDSTATYAACTQVGRSVPTINIRVDYVRPAGPGKMVATAKVRRIGRSIGLVDVDVVVGEKLVATGRADLATM